MGDRESHGRAGDSKSQQVVTIAFFFGTRDLEANWTVRLLLFVLNRATHKETWLCDCCFLLGRATQKMT